MARDEVKSKKLWEGKYGDDNDIRIVELDQTVQPSPEAIASGAEPSRVVRKIVEVATRRDAMGQPVWEPSPQDADMLWSLLEASPPGASK